jgi:TPR repeat protein
MKGVVSALLLLIATETASADEPRASVRLTWEWFNTAETYHRYKVKGPDDLRIAAHYFRLSASNGNAAAAYKLGEAYETGSGVPLDLSEALRWYRQSAAAGDMHAELKIGWFYQKGLGLKAEPSRAVEWYERSARKGNLWAYHMLAFMLMDGEGLAKDLALAQRYFEKSLPFTHDHWAQLKLSQLIRSSDPRRSKELLKQSASAGNADAIRELNSY